MYWLTLVAQVSGLASNIEMLFMFLIFSLISLFWFVCCHVLFIASCFFISLSTGPPNPQRLMSVLSYYFSGGNKVGAARSALHKKGSEDVVQRGVAKGPTRGGETDTPRPASTMSMCLYVRLLRWLMVRARRIGSPRF